MENSDLSAIFWNTIKPDEKVKPKKEKEKKTTLDPNILYAINQTDLARFINAEREGRWGANQLLLYLFYQMQWKIQKTNQPKAVNKFVKWEKNKSWLGRGNVKINKIRKELEQPTGSYKPLITPVVQKNEKGQIKWHYIKINYPIKAVRKSENEVNDTLLNNTRDLIKWINKNESKKDRINDLLKILEKDYWINFEYVDKVINTGKWWKHYSINWAWNYKPLSLRVILNLCCYIEIISSMLGITPEYNKETIRGLHRCLREIRFYQVLQRNFRVYENLLKYFIEFLENNGRDVKNISTFTDLMIQNWIKLQDTIKSFNTLTDFEEGYWETKWYLYRHWNKDYKFVLLSPEQYKDLKRKFWTQKTDKAIQVLNHIIIIEYSNFYGLYWYNKNTWAIAVDRTIQETATDEEKKNWIKSDMRKITNRIYGIWYHYIVLSELLEEDNYKRVDITATDYFYTDAENMQYLYEDESFDYRENPNFNPTNLDWDF